MLKLHNTLSGKVEEFQPLKADEVKMYNCGPTVYGRQHIGNLSMFVFTDILRRTLEYTGHAVKQVINFTDFGHLTSDSDEGEDKMAKGLKREGLSPTLENMKTMGNKYAQLFLDDLSALNVETEETTFPYASDYIEAQIELIEILEHKGFAYRTSDGIYFDTSKDTHYGKLGGLSDAGTSEARVAGNSEKKNARDFALWKFNAEIGFASEWGQGFPGWHIECSAMIRAILGETIDIHTGGIEHIPIHHNNEIAQSENACGCSLAKYWLHRAHIQISGEKIAKSEGNVVYLDEIIERGISPLALRYLFLGSHYRTPMNFTWEALEAAEKALKKLKQFTSPNPLLAQGEGRDEVRVRSYEEQFKNAIENDLNTPEALAVVWKLMKDESVADALKRATLFDFDRVLGLDLANNEYEVKEVPEEVKKLLEKREEARKRGDFAEADRIRGETGAMGFNIEDTPSGPKLSKN